VLLHVGILSVVYVGEVRSFLIPSLDGHVLRCPCLDDFIIYTIC
jgi:hypothetical protein